MEPGPEVREVGDNVGAAVLGDEAVVGRDYDGGGPVDEGNEVGGKPGRVDAVARNLDVLAWY